MTTEDDDFLIRTRKLANLKVMKKVWDMGIQPTSKVFLEALFYIADLHFHKKIDEQTYDELVDRLGQVYMEVPEKTVEK